MIPVLLGGAQMPSEHELPDTLNSLPALQAASLTDRTWDHDVQVLIEDLRGVVAARRTREPLARLHEKLYAMQAKYFAYLKRGDAKNALALAHETIQLLDAQSPQYPQDPLLPLFRGYFLKNEAMALRDLGRFSEFERALSDAERVFRIFRRESESRTASAYNGIGSVAMLRHDFSEAMRWIDRALGLVPDYDAARRDRQQVLDRIERRAG